MTTSLGDALPVEQARCRELLVAYSKIGAAGAFGVAVIENALRAADRAVLSGDLVAIIQSYEDLRGIE